MKHLLIIFSLLLTSVSRGEEYDNKLLMRDGLLYKKFSDIPFTGEVSSIFHDSIFKGMVVNGKRDGKWVLYDNDLDKTIRGIGFYKDGKYHGEGLNYHKNGQLSHKFFYDNGKLVGEWIEYHKSGKLKLKRNYINGEREGEGLSYYENGQLFTKVNYKNGKREGDFLSYDEDGNLVETKIYKNGKKIKTIKH